MDDAAAMVWTRRKTYRRSRIATRCRSTTRTSLATGRNKNPLRIAGTDQQWAACATAGGLPPMRAMLGRALPMRALIVLAFGTFVFGLFAAVAAAALGL